MRKKEDLVKDCVICRQRGGSLTPHSQVVAVEACLFLDVTGVPASILHLQATDCESVALRAPLATLQTPIERCVWGNVVMVR